jgi:molecular chaperone HscB
MIKCHSCDREQEPRLLCANCGAPLSASLDLFAALGLARKLTIDPAVLERAYHGLGRRIHPDRYASSSASLRDLSLRGTALLTRAYRTLRDPVSRGLYWLELHHHQLGENNKQVPADLAEMVFEVQEQLSDLRAARDTGANAADPLRAEIQDRRTELHRLIEDTQRHLAENFARWDARTATDAYDHLSNGANPDVLVTELKAMLSKIAYLRTLIRDIDRELESAQAA